ncbi:MAG: hydrogenase/urease maturation nickel metallochaperone HypA [Patescibacteria group bacterium]
MHDLHLADKIHRLILEKAQQNNFKRVSEVVIELGFIKEHGQDISPENLEFNLKLLNENTIAENAVITIIKVKGQENYWTLKEITGE